MASVSILTPIGIVTSASGSIMPVQILLFLRDNLSSFPPNANKQMTTIITRRISMQKTAFRPVLCLVAKITKRLLLIPCPAHKSRGVSLCVGSQKTQYVSNPGPNTVSITFVPNSSRNILLNAITMGSLFLSRVSTARYRPLTSNSGRSSVFLIGRCLMNSWQRRMLKMSPTLYATIASASFEVAYGNR